MPTPEILNRIVAAQSAEIEALTADLAAAYRCIADFKKDIRHGFLPGPTAEAAHSLTVQAAELFMATGVIGAAEPDPSAPLLDAMTA